MDISSLITQVVVALTALSAVLLALRKFTLTIKAGKIDQKTELDAATALNAKLREELRKDNEALRTRVAILEAHVETLDKEIEALQAENRVLEEAKNDLLAEIRMLKRALANHEKKIL